MLVHESHSILTNFGDFGFVLTNPHLEHDDDDDDE